MNATNRRTSPTPAERAAAEGHALDCHDRFMTAVQRVNAFCKANFETLTPQQYQDMAEEISARSADLRAAEEDLRAAEKACQSF